jgi:hypothetical protein
MDDIESRIIKVYRQYTKDRKVDSNSHLSGMWSELLDVYEGSEELMALELEFGITIEEGVLEEIYDIKISEASKVIEKMIIEQNKKNYNPEEVLSTLSPENAKKVLSLLWKNHIKLRVYIQDEMDRITYESKK